MARKKQSSSESRSWLPVLRYSGRIVFAGVVLVGGLFGLNRAERFLVRDPRFHFVTPDFGLESSSLKIQGIRYASRFQILRVFSADFGRSVYLLPLAERRAKLRELDWVKDASISRIWPNRIYVRIQEREPAAYLHMPMDRSARVAMIDADGTILQQPAHAQFILPVVTGIQAGELLPYRREKVRRLSLLMKELGPLGDRVSEVDVGDRDNTKVTARAGSRAMVLWMGDQNFAARLQSFVSHYPEIQHRLPDAATLDLRLDDRITVVGDGTARAVVVKKKGRSK